MAVTHERRRLGRVDAVLREMGESLPQGLVPARIFNDPDIHELELERIFARAWVFVGHESEIPRPGDFALRYVGNDSFIFVRDERGQVRLLLNSCRHRGTQVCRAEQGRAAHFTCPYHGWTYRTTGELTGVPAYEEGFPALDRREWSLLQAPQVASLHGFVFACLDPDAPSFDEYLGGMKWYFDLMFGLNDAGLEVAGPPQRWVMNANWKSGAENLAGDNYHTTVVHKSLFQIGMLHLSPLANMTGYHVQPGNGHALSFAVAADPADPGPQFWGLPAEVVRTFRPDKLSVEQYELARRARNTMGTVFPNFSFIRTPSSPDPERVPLTTFNRIWQWQPRGPDTVEVWSWVMVYRDTSPEFRERSYTAGRSSFGPGGLFDQDDTMPWQTIARSAGTVFFGKAGAKLNYQMGLAEASISRLETDWPGPGTAYFPRHDERYALELYTKWHEYMTRE